MPKFKTTIETILVLVLVGDLFALSVVSVMLAYETGRNATEQLIRAVENLKKKIKE